MQAEANRPKATQVEAPLEYHNRTRAAQTGGFEGETAGVGLG